MDMESAIIALAAALAIAISTIFPALGQGKVGAAAMESIARQPEAAGDIRTAMILAMALLEALTIYGLLIAFMIVGNIG
ncbi:MAG: ATP synthase F0 subunit C [Peptococcaceae bacterium]|jgi:F-type H+-transporting ATPase subunit c|nr:ATP synthase F0 subunit C [Peptococcaceae bacterium]